MTMRKLETPVNTAQKMASKSSTKQDGEATIHVFTFQGTYLILIVMLNFQYFRLDTSFLWVSSKWFGNLRKYDIDKRLVNSVIRDSWDIGFRVQFNAEFPKLSL